MYHLYKGQNFWPQSILYTEYIIILYSDDAEDDLKEVEDKVEALSLQLRANSKSEEWKNETQTGAVVDEEVRQNGVETMADAYKGPSYTAAYIRTVEEGEGGNFGSTVTAAAKLLERYQAENPDYLSGVNVVGSGGRNCRGARGKRDEGIKVAGGSEKYEKTVAKHGDKFFLKFQKELSKCPQQIIR